MAAGPGRYWDRIALVGGLVLGAVAFFVAVGSDALAPDMNRYAYFLIAPTVVTVACLARTLLIEPTTRTRAAARLVQGLACLAVGWVLLASYKANYATSSGPGPRSAGPA